MADLFQRHRPSRVVHLAAQAGVRHSIVNPHAYVDSNLVGFLHVLEECRRHRIEHLVFASSSSVYGANTRLPFSVHDNVDHPLSLYAATKKANELMAHAYAHLYGIPCTGLRFFTVYGPWGRPDMALFLFTRAILEGRPIDVFNHGNMERDFTYVDDVVEGVVRVLARPAPPDARVVRRPARSGNQPRSVPPVQHRQRSPREAPSLRRGAGGVPGSDDDEELAAHAARRRAGDPGRSVGPGGGLRRTGPKITVEEGVARFVEWYRAYYRTG